jgi:hypothetical protein
VEATRQPKLLVNYFSDRGYDGWCPVTNQMTRFRLFKLLKATNSAKFTRSAEFHPPTVSAVWRAELD